MLNFLKYCLYVLPYILSISAFATSQSLSQEENAIGSRPMRIELRHMENKGVGYTTGYTTLEAFLAASRSTWTVIPFLDLRGHVFDNGKFAANAGIGVRMLGGCRVYGLNAYYDYRNTKRQHYNQVSVGFETMGIRWDFRLNGYLPVGDRKSQPYDIHQSTALSFNSFKGNSAFVKQSITTKSKVQFAMTGGDAEVAYHILKDKNIDFYVATGPYYYNYKGKKAVGGKVRLSAEIHKYLSLELMNSYDSRFHENIQGSIGINIPFGSKFKISKNKKLKSCKDSYFLSQRLFQDVERQEIIVVDRFFQKDFLDIVSPAVNPLTGHPYHFVFVNNTSSSLGTYESPYPTLAQAEANSAPGDIIYTFPGNNTTSGMNLGITLQSNQKFWGSGTSHIMQTTLGTVTIPMQSSSMPQITNTIGNIITLATNNDISGFTLINAFDNGIFGIDPENVQISSCTINNSLSDQIHLEYATSSGTIALDNLTLTNGGTSGVFIQSTTSSPMTYAMNHCIIQNNVNEPLNLSFTNKVICDLTNNTIQNNINSSAITFNGPSTLTLSGNTIKETHFPSLSNFNTLSIIAGANPLSVTLINNTISNNDCGAVLFNLNDTQSAQLTLSNNIIENNGTSAAGLTLGSAIVINSLSSTSANCNLNLVDNTLSRNAGCAIFFGNGSFDNLQVAATSNMITGNGSAGFLFNSQCNTFTLTATNNFILDQADHGITTQANTTAANIALSHNHINGNGTPGSQANACSITQSITNLTFTAINNDLSNNDNAGIIFYSSGAIDNVILKIENNTIKNNLNTVINQSGGVDLEIFNNLSGSFKNNTLSNNHGNFDLFMAPTGSSSFCLEMSGNISELGYAFSNVNGSTGNFNLTPCNVDLVNTGSISNGGSTANIVNVTSCPEAHACPP